MDMRSLLSAKTLTRYILHLSCVMVGVDAAQTEDTIPALEDFGRIEDSWAMAADIVD